MDFPLTIPFVQAMGFELLRLHAGEADVALTLRPEQHNSLAMAHGGVTMSLLDVAMAHAARSADVPADAEPGAVGRGVVTIEMKTSFMRPAQGRMVACAKVLARTPTLAFCEARLLDPSGTLLAHSSGSFKYLTRLSTDSRRARPLKGG